MFPFPQTSTFLFLDHSIPMKPRTNVWDHFIAYDAEGNVLIERDKLKAKKVVCKHCEYERLPNAIRMKKMVYVCVFIPTCYRRPRLAIEHLVQEVCIHVNHFALVAM